MSSTIARNISVSKGAPDRPLLFMSAAGLAAAAAQVIFLREYLSIFSGSELVIGVIFAFWLLAAAAGSHIGSVSAIGNWRPLSFLYIFSVVLGIVLLRASRLLFLPGVVVPPWAVTLIVLLTQSAAAFFGGCVFGRLARQGNGGRLYSAENAGAAAGLILVSVCVLLYCPNGGALAAALALFAVAAFMPHQDRQSKSAFVKTAFVYYAAAALLLACFLAIDPVSVRWKYAPQVDKVVNGRSGEIALAQSGKGNIFLNGTLYRAAMSLPSVEQAVHLPAAVHAGPLRRALVVGNTGQVRELTKYPGLSVVCCETEPVLAAGGCVCSAAEELAPEAGRPFDLVLLGCGMPSNVAESRFYTISFFRKMRALTDRAGVFSFTLPLSGNYLSRGERRLKDIMQTTLAGAFRHVLIVPGEGYTFIASDKPLALPAAPLVATDYLEAYTMASLTPERLAQANAAGGPAPVNTINRPFCLLAAEQQWLGLFGFPPAAAAAALAACFVLALIISPRTRAALSVGTSGFAAGVYSVALLLMYQFSHGTLYSQVAVLMVALTAGFAAGSFVRRFPFSDFLIGIYAALALTLLVVFPFPPLALFCVLHAGMGLLAGAQFVTRKGAASWGGLYAADLAGGVFGMALCSTLLVPYFGVTAVALGLGVLKCACGLFTLRK
jgi:spermidine synthase